MIEARRRSTDMERAITEHAARGACDPEGLIVLAESRADRRGAYRGVDRDWLREAREELADMRNYLCWWLEERIENDGEDRARVIDALRLCALAFAALTEVD